MAIPDFQTIMLPLLKDLSDRQEHSLRELIEKLSVSFKLSDDDLRAVLLSGQQKTFDNRVGWARTDLKKAGLVESTKRGYIKITNRGLDVLKANPPKIDRQFLKQYPEYKEFLTAHKKEKQEVSPSTPAEVLETTYQGIRNEIAEELLEQVKSLSPSFFEKLVVELLVNMGYGGSMKEAAGKVTAKSGDEGIDGVINEDKLGLDMVYIQAKRWDKGTTGRPEIQKFVGALHGKGAKKGVFITTSDFSREAREFIERTSDFRIVLINGSQLTQFMIDNNIGVTPVAKYEIKRIDTDYFTEE